MLHSERLSLAVLELPGCLGCALSTQVRPTEVTRTWNITFVIKNSSNCILYYMYVAHAVYLISAGRCRQGLVLFRVTKSGFFSNIFFQTQGKINSRLSLNFFSQKDFSLNSGRLFPEPKFSESFEQEKAKDDPKTAQIFQFSLKNHT